MSSCWTFSTIGGGWSRERLVEALVSGARVTQYGGRAAFVAVLIFLRPREIQPHGGPELLVQKMPVECIDLALGKQRKGHMMWHDGDGLAVEGADDDEGLGR